MSRPATKLVPVNALRLHDGLPIQSFSFRPSCRVGPELLVGGYCIIDKASNDVVAGIAPMMSAQAASVGRKTPVKVVCLYMDGVPETFATTWPLLEAAVSQLSRSDCMTLLVELLKSEAACVRQDAGRRLSKDFGICERNLKRARKTAREAKLSAPDVVAKKRKVKTKNAVSDATVAANAPMDPAPVETVSSSDAPTPTTAHAMDAHPAVETFPMVSLEPALLLACESSVTVSHPGVADPTAEASPSDGTARPIGPADDTVIKAAPAAPASAPMPTHEAIRVGGPAIVGLPNHVANDWVAEYRAPPWSDPVGEPGSLPASSIDVSAAAGLPRASGIDVAADAAARTIDAAIDASNADEGTVPVIEVTPDTSDDTDERGDDVTTGERSAAPPVTENNTVPSALDAHNDWSSADDRSGVDVTSRRP